MPFNRKSVKYNSAGLFLTDSPEINGQTIDQIHFFNRVQSTNISVGVNRQNLKQLGSKEFIDRKIVTEFDVNLSFDYLLTDGTEEYILGLGVASGVFGTLDDGSEPNIPCLKTSESSPLSPNVYQDLKDNKNAFFVVGAEEFDITGYLEKSGGFSGTDCISIANCYLTNYNVSAAVGSFAKASVQMRASNLNYNNLTVSSIGELAALLLEIDIFDTDFVRLEGGGKILLNSNLGSDSNDNSHVDAFGALNLVNSGSGITGTIFSFEPEMYNSAASAIPHGGINVYIEELTMGGPVIGQDTTGMLHSGHGNVQSFDISVPFERENLLGFSSMNAYGRKMKYPQLGTVSVSLLQDAFTSGSLQEMLCEDGEYNMNIYLNNDCASIFGGEDASSTFMQFQVSNMKLDSYSLSNSLGERGTVDCNFSFEMSANKGLKIRSSAPNPKLPCGEYPPKEPSEAPPFVAMYLETYGDALKYGRAVEKTIEKDLPSSYTRSGKTKEYFSRGDKVRLYMTYDLSDFACHKMAVLFQAIDPQSPEFIDYAGKNNISVYPSATAPSEPIQFTEEWEQGVPEFNSAGAFAGYRTIGNYVGLYRNNNAADLSTAYIDFEIGYNNDFLPVFFKTINFEGDFSYHSTIPISALGELYQEPYAILVLN